MEKRIHFRRRIDKQANLEPQFWLRAFAFTIDLFIIRLLLVPGFLALLSLLSVFPDGRSGDSTNESALYSLRTNSGIYVVVYLLVFILYGALLESSRLQGTLGKWFVKYSVCDTGLNRISLPRALVRNALKVVSMLTVIGVFVIDMTPKRQGLHDFITGTILTRK